MKNAMDKMSYWAEHGLYRGEDYGDEDIRPLQSSLRMLGFYFLDLFVVLFLPAVSFPTIASFSLVISLLHHSLR